jgi:UDP-N-acetylglucosamine transferase subunit ALG13
VIFVTVGTQLPFDRLVSAIDTWAGRVSRRDVVAQIGPSNLRPEFIDYRAFLSPSDFSSYFERAELVIAHAGMGSILGAMSRGKPILIMPRLARLKEHRNDHQVATAKRFMESGRVLVAMDAEELDAQLSRLESIPPPARTGPHASSELMAVVRGFLAGDRSS